MLGSPLAVASEAVRFDLTSVLGQNTAFLGFTSATGAGYNDHDILTWVYRDEFNPIGSAVPEPASIAMWGLGAIALLFAGRKRRPMRLAV